MQVDHLIFALSRLDVTGDGSDKIVVCAWDGHTYFLDQECNSVRFQFEEPVRAFCAGNYSLSAGTSTPSLVYATFTNKVYVIQITTQYIYLNTNINTHLMFFIFFFSDFFIL